MKNKKVTSDYGISKLGWSVLAAQSAEQLSLATAPLLAVLLFDANAGQIGLLTAIQTLPFLLMSIPLGLLADRIPKRAIMLAGETLRAVSLVLMLVLFLTSKLSICWLAILGFTGATGTVGFNIASPGLITSLVPRDLLSKANARVELARSSAFSAGPALAGTLVAWAGASNAFLLAIVLSIIAILIIWRIRPDLPFTKVKHRHPFIEIAEGAIFICKNPILRQIIIVGLIFNVSWFILQAVYIPYAVHTLGLNAQLIGGTMAMYGLGMVTGSLITHRVGHVIFSWRVIQVGPLSGFLAALSLALTLIQPTYLFAGLCFFLLGAGPMMWTITTTTLRQNITPDNLIGRVTSVFLTVNAGARPIGAALGGVLGTHYGNTVAILIALAGFFLQATVCLYLPISSLRELTINKSK
ncbi:MFS transporter [Pantoea sp. Acro-805]|uniref:MFS transporter n=1 Tax=Candidatus Pantoea formicae TaxID=2608355 RepID=A0ABX0R6N1_9GAMM|nr:MFS transporter [Pantoea formicae]NIF03794.1 MFS transporter [Pantoea formicae]